MNCTKKTSKEVFHSTCAWLGVRDDYRTLIGLKGVNVVNKSDEMDEEKGYEEPIVLIPL